MVAAHRALGIAAQLQLAETHVEGVIQQQAADEWLPDAQNQFDRLRRLNQADDAGEYTEYAPLGAARHETWRRRFRVEAAIARTTRYAEHRRLSFEAEDAAVRVRLAEQNAGVVHQVASRKIVGAVDDDVVVAE